MYGTCIVAVIDRGLRNVPRGQLDLAIPETLSNVCKPDHFDISEFSKTTVAEACEHIVGKFSVWFSQFKSTDLQFLTRRNSSVAQVERIICGQE
jgi:hypothetical protein